MKGMLTATCVLVAVAGFALSAFADDDPGDPSAESPTVTEPYFGEREPGVTPRLFAPSVLGSNLHAPPIFSSDGASVYWCRMDGREILWARLEDEAWQQPKIVRFAFAFASVFASPDSPFLSADGERLYFTSFGGGLFHRRETLWFVERTESGWGSPQSLPFEETSPSAHWAFSMTTSGTLYFGFEEEIYVAECNSGVYGSPRPIGPPISSSGLDAMPYVASDGSYLLFASNGHADHLGNIDLYLSIRQPDGSWGDPIHLPYPVNSVHQDLYPTVSPDGKYLFFLSTRGGNHRAYWVDASVVTDLLPHEASEEGD